MGMYILTNGHCILVVSDKCEQGFNEMSWLIGFKGIVAQKTWCFNAGIGYCKPSQDTAKDDLPKDDEVVHTGNARRPDADQHFVVYDNRYNCCDRLSEVPGDAGIEWSKPNPTPFGDWPADELVYPDVIKVIVNSFDLLERQQTTFGGRK